MGLSNEEHAMIAGATVLVSIALVGFLKFHWAILLLVFLAIWGLNVFIDFDIDLIYLSAVSAVLGIIVPLIMVLFKAIEFHPPAFLGIPLWLPILFANITIACVRLSNWLAEKF